VEIASITTSLAPLAVLACPVGMGAMMWVMMRGNQSQQSSNSDSPPDDAAELPPLELLREEHDRLREEIERLQRRQAESVGTQ
jgi:hypothetical protein